MRRRSGKRGGLGLAALVGLLGGTIATAGAEPRYQRLARDLVGPDQGVFVRAENGTVLASVAAERPVHPASVSKVATTLALLAGLGPDHRFPTRLLAGGPIQDGALAGDLLVRAGGDPFLVSENALLMLAALRCLGVDEVAGRLRVAGDEELTFNWVPDPEARAMAIDLEGASHPSAWLAVANAEPDLLRRGPASLGIRFRRKAVAVSTRPRPLLEHRSPPLRRILKELNGFSNNIFHPLARHVGGVAEVERRSRAAIAPELRAEVVIHNAAGAGRTNRISPRAAAALVDALGGELSRRGLDLADVLPVAGVDPGTLSDRFDSAALRGVVVGKTGTYGSLGASALAGAARTRAHGVVTFAILNRGVAVPEARRRQDAFLTALLREAGAVPWGHEPSAKPPFAEAEVATLVPGSGCAFPATPAGDRTALRPRPATPAGRGRP
jgi:D-alanyl-D-alanine carboxypeptidase/D-alanyl-D-alanine-endopeptidase (penicillin-binding protein 4)